MNISARNPGEKVERITALTPELLERTWPSDSACRMWLNRRGTNPKALGCIIGASATSGVCLQRVEQELLPTIAGATSAPTATGKVSRKRAGKRAAAEAREDAIDTAIAKERIAELNFEQFATQVDDLLKAGNEEPAQDDVVRAFMEQGLDAQATVDAIIQQRAEALVGPAQQELPACHRHPDQLCSGDCQYLLAQGECAIDLAAAAVVPPPLAPRIVSILDIIARRYEALDLPNDAEEIRSMVRAPVHQLRQDPDAEIKLLDGEVLARESAYAENENLDPSRRMEVSYRGAVLREEMRRLQQFRTYRNALHATLIAQKLPQQSFDKLPDGVTEDRVLVLWMGGVWVEDVARSIVKEQGREWIDPDAREQVPGLAPEVTGKAATGFTIQIGGFFDSVDAAKLWAGQYAKKLQTDVMVCDATGLTVFVCQSKAPKAERAPRVARAPSAGSGKRGDKLAVAIEMMERDGGASGPELKARLGWENVPGPWFFRHWAAKANRAGDLVELGRIDGVLRFQLNKSDAS